MNTTTRQLLEQVQRLPEEERQQFISALFETFDEEDDAEIAAAWDAEIQARMARIESGESKGIAWEKAESWIFGATDDAPPPTN